MCWIDDLAPATGSMDGQEMITITGFGFQPTDRVFFGIYPSPSVTWRSPNEMDVVTPASPAPGTATVRVVDDNCTRICLDVFTYQ
jgi:hypothetical protein